MVFATPKFAIQAYIHANKLGWRPLVVNNMVSASSLMNLAVGGRGCSANRRAARRCSSRTRPTPAGRKDPATKLLHRRS